LLSILSVLMILSTLVAWKPCLREAGGQQPPSKCGGALDVSSSNCRHLALLRMPAWSECRRILANDMHALDASPYLAISTIDAVGAEREAVFEEQQRDET
jgi:hypothetical protein